MQNDKEAIKLLYDKYAVEIYRYARLTIGNSVDAHDVVQEVFFRAFKSWQGFRRDASERTWLMSIARNYIFDVLRSRRNDREFLSNYTPLVLEDEKTRVETVMMFEEILSELKEEYRQVFVLRHVQDMTVADVAKILGWSKGKVRTTDFRAMAKVRNVLISGKEVQGLSEFKTQN